MAMDRLRVAAYVWLVAGLGWFVLEAIAASAYPSYTYARNYISNLGNPSQSPLATVMNFDFIAHGVLFLGGAASAIRVLSAGGARYVFIFFVALNAIGGVIVAIVHNSAPAVSSGVTALHGLGALAAILGGNLAVIVAGSNTRKIGASRLYCVASVAIGIIGLASFLVLIRGSGSLADNGIWERGSVYTIMLWEITTGIAILRR